MEFEFDPKKSAVNKQKHGIDFQEARALWTDNNLLVLPAKHLDEPRCLLVGKIAEKYWSAFVTFRGEVVRIISVRRARKEEIAIYEGD